MSQIKNKFNYDINNTNVLGKDIIFINDELCHFDEEDGFNLYQLCLMNDLQLPRFRYHNKLSIAGNCRVCLVELEKSIKLVISCAIIAEKKSIIFTDTKLVKDSQEAIFEYLLINPN